jgi:hypothetical protein
VRKTLVAAALGLAWPAGAEEPHAPPPAPPDPEMLVFLGETGGEDAELVLYMDTRDAKKALRQAGKEEPKEDHHE